MACVNCQYICPSISTSHRNQSTSKQWKYVFYALPFICPTHLIRLNGHWKRHRIRYQVSCHSQIQEHAILRPVSIIVLFKQMETRRNIDYKVHIAAPSLPFVPVTRLTAKQFLFFAFGVGGEWNKIDGVNSLVFDIRYHFTLDTLFNTTENIFFRMLHIGWRWRMPIQRPLQWHLLNGVCVCVWHVAMSSIGLRSTNGVNRTVCGVIWAEHLYTCQWYVYHFANVSICSDACDSQM